MHAKVVPFRPSRQSDPRLAQPALLQLGLYAASLPAAGPRRRVVVVDSRLVLLWLEVGVVVVGHIEVAVLECCRLQRLLPPPVVVDILGKLAILTKAQGMRLLRWGGRGDRQRRRWRLLYWIDVGRRDPR